MKLTAQQLFDCTQHFNYDDLIDFWEESGQGDILATNGYRTIRLNKNYGPKRIGYENSWERIENV